LDEVAKWIQLASAIHAPDYGTDTGARNAPDIVASLFKSPYDADVRHAASGTSTECK
jgi:hypothetical protein